MLGEAMVAMRGVGMAAKGITGKGFGSSGGGGGSASADNGGNGAFAGGLAGIVSRKFSQGAAAAATGQGGIPSAGRPSIPPWPKAAPLPTGSSAP